MPIPTKTSKPGQGGGKDTGDAETPSNNLWVGNLTSDVSDSDLMDLFAQYGALDSVTTYSSRSYAFVFFNRMEDAKAAKDSLQGTVVRGNTLKIEFARPAKPCKQLWVGGISPAISKEELEEEFLKFGKIEDFRFLRNRNTAFVEYFRLEDATQAMRAMNGKRIGGDQIRVDFLRSQPSRREQWLDSRDGQFQDRRNAPSDSLAGQKRPQHPLSSMGRKGDGQPSNVLWIGYPPSVQIDEQMLHNAMILFGEIERIKSFPSRHYSFVEFRSVDEACRAKEGLQGRLFNDPRITIMFSSSDLAPGKDYPGLFPGSKEQRPDVFLNEHPFRPLQMDVFGHNRPIVPNNFSGQLPPGGILGPNAQTRPFGPQGSLEPLLSGPEFNDLATLHKFQDGNSKNLIGPNWRRPSPPASGMLPSPAPGIKPSTRSMSGAWDVLDINQFQRDPKRLRIDGALSIDEASRPLRDIVDHGLALEQSYGLDPLKRHLSPVGARINAGVPASAQPDVDYIWRGVIAKGGTHVCHARCLPIGEGIETELPEVVNCSARTGLDMLSKHYAEAIGYDIVFFLPDSEDDFASYTEFLRYLGEKNRAGVAKFDDGTTLFLVPPSEFLTKVLKVAGPERLYGVVLKFPPAASTTTIQQPTHFPISSSQYIDRQQIPPPQVEYSLVPPKEEQVLPMDRNRVLHDDLKLPPKPLYLPAVGSPSMHSVPPGYASGTNASTSQAGVSLTPELIATLASLLPSTTQSSALDGTKSAGGSSNIRPPFPSGAPGDGTQSQMWKQDYQTSYPTSHLPQQLGTMFNPLNPQYQPYTPMSNVPGNTAQLVSGSSQIPESTASLQQQGAVSSRPLLNYAIPSHGGQLAASPQASFEYQIEVPQSGQKGYGLVQGTDSSGSYSSPAFQQPNNSGDNPSQPQQVMPIASELPNQMRNLQSGVLGADQGSSEVEVDKNQRYQSTLQFAANLLLQIQQQQHQTQGGREPGNQQ
ncbi:Flowering time control protein FPA [Quillaja saponaria]|uniref:Flowering time control protein FPA n=1 Tax=Quillaja saponaria TaxID=32244 RepID=A0AAD7VM52_QUISA|nr:Flowering time control protein FPA [Quillaja saponaria]